MITESPLISRPPLLGARGHADPAPSYRDPRSVSLTMRQGASTLGDGRLLWSSQVILSRPTKGDRLLCEHCEGCSVLFIAAPALVANSPSKTVVHFFASPFRLWLDTDSRIANESAHRTMEIARIPPTRKVHRTRETISPSTIPLAGLPHRSPGLSSLGDASVLVARYDL
jgi:hypothetical protein